MERNRTADYVVEKYPYTRTTMTIFAIAIPTTS